MVLPDSFDSATHSLMGDEIYRRFIKALDEPAPVSIRVNTAKTSLTPADSRTVDWCREGYYLYSRPQFTFDPLLHAGCYYVQEASSMFVSHVLRTFVDGPVKMLDMCAAPGGKTTAALAVLPAGSALVANEPVKQRASVLAENIAKWGAPNVIVTNNYPEDIAAAGMVFDVILCDVPCSGEGMFRKDPDAVGEWSAENVAACSRLQRDIVSRAWQCLRPGGLLIYSTCTYNSHEDEENVAWICNSLGATLKRVPVQEGWGITGSLRPDLADPVYRFIPGFTNGEGLFMAVLQKDENDFMPAVRKPRQKKRLQQRNPSKKAVPMLRDWLKDAGGYDIFPAGNIYVALPENMKPLYDQASAAGLRVLSAGVTLGVIKGSGAEVIPSTALALSTAFNRQAFPHFDLSYAQAIAFLRREQVVLPEGFDRGFICMTWQDKPLGFVKNVGVRVNTQFPAEWRIKSTHAPGEDSRPRVFVEGTNE